MKKTKLSRTPNIDIEKIIKSHQNNKFDLVIHAAMLARSIQKKNRSNLGYYNAPIEALLEIGEHDGKTATQKVRTT